MVSPNLGKDQIGHEVVGTEGAVRSVPRGFDEDQGYYARERVRWLRRCLDELGERPATMLDFGCGDGLGTPHFFSHLPIRSLLGVDVRRDLLAVAEDAAAHADASYVHLGDYRATESMDLAYTCGAFGRLPWRERTAAAVLVLRSLKPGGLFALWEHNPWSPSTLWNGNGKSTRRAEPAVTPTEARQLLRGVGFDIVHTTSTFYFPRAVSWCRAIEPMLATIPLGGQYMVLARKP
jgi:SAM-dependent methyltransferase